MENQEQNQSEPQVNVEQANADQAVAPEAQAPVEPTAPVDEKPEVKETNLSAAPRHAGKVAVKKAKTYAEIEAKKQIESAKLWSSDILEAQLSSKVCSEEMKKACAEELKARAEKRKKLLKK